MRLPTDPPVWSFGDLPLVCPFEHLVRSKVRPVSVERARTLVFLVLGYRKPRPGGIAKGGERGVDELSLIVCETVKEVAVDGEEALRGGKQGLGEA